MGYWGEGIFQNDTELDIVDRIGLEACQITSDADLDIYRDNEELMNMLMTGHLDFTSPRNREELVAKLNNGLFEQLAQRFLARREFETVIILGAHAMRLGATVGDGVKRYIRRNLKESCMLPPAKAQVMKALKEYKNNGLAWDFESPGLCETAGMAMAGEAGHDVSSKLISLSCLLAD